MAVTINGTTGVAAPAVSDSGDLTFTGTGNRITGDFSNATVANRVIFQTSTVNGGTTIGVLPNGTATQTNLQLYNGTDPANTAVFALNCTSAEARVNSAIFGTGTYLPMTFYTNGSERMRIDTSGNLLVGTTSANTVYGTKVTLSTDSGTTKWGIGPYTVATNFVISAIPSGGVYLNGTSANAWTSTSDERVKNIIEPIVDAVQKVNTLRTVIGTFKNDDEQRRRAFLIAQDLQKVLPEVVDDSNPDMLGIQITDTIPLLVAAIKELSAEVEALKAKVGA